ncbi:MAG: DUF4474 domain-containing protein [Clostridia bacterium]|nr:DUF4474 domain-containing protein [Clostridia bacterium]
MKRAISLFLSIIMIFSVMVISVNADQTTAQNPNEIDVSFMNNLTNALSFFKYGIKDTRVYLKPTERDNVSEFYIDYTNNEGADNTTGLGAYYNHETGEVFGFNYDKGVFDSGFAYNAFSNQFYATNDCWQRQFGFTPIYDIMAKLAFDYTTKRIFFEYEGKDWMIQIWKGNYVFDMFVGGEIGVYNKPDGKLGMFYDCASDAEMMPISMKVYSDERTYINREETLTWWSTGFVLADPVDPMSLTMEGTITFPTEEMCSAFANSTEFVFGVDCTQDGAVATLVW